MEPHRLLRPVTHCIFDLDGLLVDSERIYSESTQKILDPFGKKYTFDVKMRAMGLHSEEIANLIIDTYQLPFTVEEYQRQHYNYSMELLKSVPLMAGAERLVRHLHTCQVPICVATSCSQASYDVKSKPHMELFQRFHHVVKGSSDPEVKRSKPHPDIFLIAASRFCPQPRPQCCLVFEDSPNGVQAALAANMQVVLVPDPRLPQEVGAKATLRLNSLEEFKPQYFGLPPL